MSSTNPALAPRVGPALQTPPSYPILPADRGYDRWSAIYDEELNPLIILEERFFPPLIGDVRGLAVADIGCGTGRHAVRLAREGAARVVGVDFSAGMLARAKEKPGAERIELIVHDLHGALPLASDTFDRVICALVLDHIRNVDELFRELARITKPGGHICISAFHPAMTLLGVQARFVDPATGEKIAVASVPYELSDFVMAMVRAKLEIDHLSEHRLDTELARGEPRLEKYVGWPLVFLARLVRR